SASEVAYERVRDSVRVVRDEVRRARREGEVAVVGAEDNGGRSAPVGALLSAVAEAGQDGVAGREIADEAVGDVVRVARGDVRGQRGKRDVAAIRADARRPEALAVRLLPVVADTNAGGPAGWAVVHAGGERVVRVAGGEGRGVR